MTSYSVPDFGCLFILNVVYTFRVEKCISSDLRLEINQLTAFTITKTLRTAKKLKSSISFHKHFKQNKWSPWENFESQRVRPLSALERPSIPSRGLYAKTCFVAMLLLRNQSLSHETDSRHFKIFL